MYLFILNIAHESYSEELCARVVLLQYKHNHFAKKLQFESRSFSLSFSRVTLQTWINAVCTLIERTIVNGSLANTFIIAWINPPKSTLVLKFKNKY